MPPSTVPLDALPHGLKPKVLIQLPFWSLENPWLWALLGLLALLLGAALWLRKKPPLQTLPSPPPLTKSSQDWLQELISLRPAPPLNELAEQVHCATRLSQAFRGVLAAENLVPQGLNLTFEELQKTFPHIPRLQALPVAQLLQVLESLEQVKFHLKASLPYGQAYAAWEQLSAWSHALVSRPQEEIPS